DRLADAVDLSAGDLCILIRSELRLVGWKIDRVRAMPTALERRNEALPAGGRLARAVDEDEVAQMLDLLPSSRLEHHTGQCPRPESNQRTRFRKPLLYPLSYGG